MTRRAYIYFFVTIILGAILGGAGVYYYLWNSGRLQRPHGFNPEHAVAHLKKDLNLNDDQVRQLRQIFEESGQKTRDLQKQIDPQFQAIHMDTRAHIRQILNPDQQKKFDEMVRAIDQRHRQHGDSMPPPR